ncbi:MAG: N-formylglutamate amidohydrolase [Elusimicrobiota bacterium]
MKLPLIISVPHAGVRVPSEVGGLCRLSPEEIAADGDVGAREIFAIENEVEHHVTTDISRVFADLNRAPDDLGKDGAVKSHTLWDVRVYCRPLKEQEKMRLIESYHRPYHRRLAEHARADVRLGIDCHTMAPAGPALAPDPGMTRPEICLCNAGGTCPQPWFDALAACLEQTFELYVARNEPFAGGYIISEHSKELPWVQLLFSSAPFMSSRKKREGLLDALERWCRRRL